jgi:hypothetical protein
VGLRLVVGGVWAGLQAWEMQVWGAGGLGERPMGFAKLIACENPVWDGCISPVNSPKIAWRHVVGLHVVQQVVLSLLFRRVSIIMSASMNPLPVAPAAAAACMRRGAPSSAAFDTWSAGARRVARATGCVHGARGCAVVRCDRAGLAVAMVARGALLEAEVDRHRVRDAAA